MKKLLCILIVLLFPAIVFASWKEHTDVSYLDLDGDLVNEIIIESNHGAGSNHYIEDLRIFKDVYPELKLIFHTRTLDRTFGFDGEKGKYNYDIVSQVKFTEPNAQSGTRDIVVKSKKTYYKDKEQKVVDREEDLGTRIYKLDNGSFVEQIKRE